MKIHGIYNADGGIIGELQYVLGKIMGKAHCSLCDITHSYISKKKSWKALESRGEFGINLLHINEQIYGNLPWELRHAFWLKKKVNSGFY